MPIYEFYCVDCHTIYSFLSRTVDTRKRPACPGCGRPRLERRASRFAISSGGPTPAVEEEGLPEGLDEAKIEQAMEGLARHAEGADEDDPRTMVRMMRRFYEDAGMPVGEGMEEALRRMESGEDPDKVEEEMGDLLEQEDQLFGQVRLKGAAARRRRALRVDAKLYEM